ncbi:hypothetical protein ELI07_15200 [Rhizobium leguminosarum]|uniref:hypothetical protein n=1 Tax=Rhizobium leguminosarum TaxID=384 RepID=UPI00102FAA40|nr:hypothetical protein [Rhizobium leguminosarum]TAX10753.1 hypothetical protein ELI07_15200 [Rhizobium leguminosarum]
MNISRRMNAVALLPRTTSQANAYSDIPTLDQVSVEYGELKQRYDAINQRLVEIFQRAFTVAESIRQGGSDTQTVRPNALRVAAILEEDPPVAPSSRTADMLRDLDAQERDLKDALHLLTSRVSDLRMTASAAICEQVAPQHHQKVNRICVILLDLYEACADYEDFGDALNAREVAWSALNPMFPSFCRPGDRYSVVAHYLKEAAAKGFVRKADLPERIFR